MIYTNVNLSHKTAVLKAALDKAEALIIGAGAGLSRTRLRWGDPWCLKFFKNCIKY
ncbi:hypothetical protein LQZ21_06735 [Treponema sp. TIM-1]|uniref:hypothetical protein n=1 Tax=Treponema sp. TIM-1 TaxID=2898417 RepID=UPI0039815A84